MRILPAIATCGLVLAAAPLPPAQTPAPEAPPAGSTAPAPRPKKGRARLLAQLDEHLGTAIANARLEPKQVTRLEKDRETFRLAADRRNKQKPVRKTVDKSLHSVLQVFEEKGEAFRPEDRGLVLDDLRQLQPPPKARRPRPMRPPGPRRWPGF